MKRKVKVIGRREVKIEGRTYAVAVLAPREQEIKEEPIASRNDAATSWQRFMREQHLRPAL